MQITGTLTAIVTPFRAGNVDIPALKRILSHQIENEIDGIVLLGSTGEKLTLTRSEQEEVVCAASETIQKKVPLIVSAAAVATSATIEEMQWAKELGADAVLMSPPWYIRPSEDGLYKHFLRAADEGGLPIIAYNIPKRTGVSLSVALLTSLAKHPNIIGIKESSGDISSVSELLFKLRESECIVYAGDDSIALPLLSLGAQGLISVAANVLPKQIGALVRSALNGDFAEARAIHEKLFPLFQALQSDVNPVPIKAAMELCGMTSCEVRAPLLMLEEMKREAVKIALTKVTA